jgi:hypothetical protein
MTKQTQSSGVQPAITTMGENVLVHISGEKLIIEIDLTHRGGVSPSGKTIRVASTLGNQRVAGTEVVLGINAYVQNR